MKRPILRPLNTDLETLGTERKLLAGALVKSAFHCLPHLFSPTPVITSSFCDNLLPFIKPWSFMTVVHLLAVGLKLLKGESHVFCILLNPLVSGPVLGIEEALSCRAGFSLSVPRSCGSSWLCPSLTARPLACEENIWGLSLPFERTLV